MAVWSTKRTLERSMPMPKATVATTMSISFLAVPPCPAPGPCTVREREDRLAFDRLGDLAEGVTAERVELDQRAVLEEHQQRLAAVADGYGGFADPACQHMDARRVGLDQRAILEGRQQHLPSRAEGD